MSEDLVEGNAYRRVILVTGSSTGIGYGLVRRLASLPAGHTVYLTSRSESDARNAQTKLCTEDGLFNVKFVVLDVTDEESLRRARDVLEKEEGRLDTLVNNAGLALAFHPQYATSISLPNTLRPVLDVNFFGLVTATTTFLPLLAHSKPGYGCVLNITSELGSNTLNAKGERREAVVVAYRTGKAAVNSYTVSLAKEMRREGEGEIFTKVNAVTPGTTMTRMNEYVEGGRTLDEAADVLVPWCILGPEDKDKTGRYWGPNGEIPW